MGFIDSIFGDPDENCVLNEAQLKEDGKFQFFEIAWVCCAIATILACGFSFYLIYKHCRNYTSKYQQRYIIRILLMVPIYAIDSFLSYRLYTIAIYFDVIRDCYEAFVINTFFCLLIEYTGGYQKTKETFAQHETVKLIFPLNCIRVRPKRGLLRSLKRMTLQYTLIRPITAIAAVALQSVNRYCPGNWNFTRGYIYITALLFVSVTIAMYALIQFYTLAKKAMAPHKPIGKFLAVKFVIFFAFWQSIAVAGLVYIKVIKQTSGWTTDNVAEGVQNVLICAEMVIVAVIHIFVFSYKPYVKAQAQARPMLSTLAHVFNPFDIYKDCKYSFFPKKKKGNRKKKTEMNPKDLSKNNEIIVNPTPPLSPAGADATPTPPPPTTIQVGDLKKKAKYKKQVDVV